MCMKIKHNNLRNDKAYLPRPRPLPLVAATSADDGGGGIIIIMACAAAGSNIPGISAAAVSGLNIEFCDG